MRNEDYITQNIPREPCHSFAATMIWGSGRGDGRCAARYSDCDYRFYFCHYNQQHDCQGVVVGTLRASGYTRGELVAHYLSMPVIVTLVAALIGNILGYTVFKNIVVSMYYNSYSLPTYETIWNPDAFIKTTMIPLILMFVVNLVVIARMMRHTPLQFCGMI